MTRADLSYAVWRKSSRSGGCNGGGNECVEVAALPDGQIAVRNSKYPEGAVLFFTRPKLAAWIKAVKHHEFDDPT